MLALSFLAHISSHYCFFFQAPDTQAKERREVAAFEGLVEGKVLSLTMVGFKSGEIDSSSVYKQITPHKY